MILKLVPQFLISGFMLKMIYNSYAVYNAKPSEKNEKDLINLIAGVIVFNAVLVWGGFYTVEL